MPWPDDSALVSPTVPAGTPRLASWWWRALLAGATLGLIPLLAVLWHFGDEPIAAGMDAVWPGALRWLGSIFSPLGWMLAVSLVAAWRISTRRTDEASGGWMSLACMLTAWVACGAFHLMGVMAGWTVPAERAAGWSHLSPSGACAVPVALAATLWARRSSLRWPVTALAALTMAAEVADGVAWASDALAGAWCGVAASAALPLALWMRGRDGAAVRP